MVRFDPHALPPFFIYFQILIRIETPQKLLQDIKCWLSQSICNNYRRLPVLCYPASFKNPLAYL